MNQQQLYETIQGINSKSSEAIAHLIHMGFEMRDQGEPQYDAIAMGMVALISEMGLLNEMIYKLLCMNKAPEVTHSSNKKE